MLRKGQEMHKRGGHGRRGPSLDQGLEAGLSLEQPPGQPCKALPSTAIGRPGRETPMANSLLSQVSYCHLLCHLPLLWDLWPLRL